MKTSEAKKQLKNFADEVIDLWFKKVMLVVSRDEYNDLINKASARCLRQILKST